MPTTPVYNLPYPDSDDTPDVPFHTQALAEAVDDRLADLWLNAAEIPDALHLEAIAAGTTDASGFRTISHSAPFTPSAIFLINTAPGGTFGIPWGVTSITATTFSARFMNASSGGPLVSTSSGSMLALMVK